MPSLKFGDSPTNEGSKSDKDSSEEAVKDGKDKPSSSSLSDDDIQPHSPKTKPEGPTLASNRSKSVTASTSTAVDTKGTDSVTSPDASSTSGAGPSGKGTKAGAKQQAGEQDSVHLLIKSIDTMMVFFKQQLKGTEET